jgi:hypothetical protein
MSACDELEGIAKYHVVTFQQIAPARPANTTGRVTNPGATMALAIVAATFKDKKAPRRLNTAPRSTATRGFIAPVAIEEAIAFAVSWKPFVKSNATAVPTMRMRT